MDPVFPNRINGVVKARLRGLIAQLEESRQVDHAATKGALREKYLTDFLQSLLPPNYTVSGGFICDVLGSVSPQIDLILADTSTIPSIAFASDVSLIPVEAAIGAVEVKSTLTTLALKQIQAQAEVIGSLRPIAEVPDHGRHGVRLFIFAYESEVSEARIIEWFDLVPALFGVCIVGGQFTRRAPEGIASVEEGDMNEVLVFISSLLHAIIKAREERLPQSLNSWRAYIVGVDPSLAGEAMP